MKYSEDLSHKSNFHQYRSLKVPDDIPSLKQRARSADKNRISIIQSYCQNITLKGEAIVQKQVMMIILTLGEVVVIVQPPILIVETVVLDRIKQL